MKKLICYIPLFILFIGLTGLFNYGYAQKSEEAILQLLQERDQQIKALLGPEGSEYTQQQRDELKDIINDVINYEAMAQYALQDQWTELSSTEKEEFVDLFSSIIRDQSLSKLDIYRADVTYRDISINGDDAVVTTMATREDVRTPVVYEMHYKEDAQKWVVTDFSIDDISTAESYRRQFQNIINKDGYEKLLDTLRKRANRDQTS